MSNNKQTAVEWLVEKLADLTFNYIAGFSTKEEYDAQSNQVIEQAKEMEKQQMFEFTNYHHVTKKGTKMFFKKVKHFIAKILFGEPLVMSLYQDKYGNKYGGTIHKGDELGYVDNVRHIEEPQYLGKVKIYL